MISTSGRIKYRKLKSGGYQLLGDWWCETGIMDNAARIDGFVYLDSIGKVTVVAGYKWDGCSGPAIDRKSNMRCGLLHDGLYQLMRASKLPQEYRRRADELFRELHVQDGGYRVMGWLDYVGLRVGAGYAAKVRPEIEAQELWAP